MQDYSIRRFASSAKNLFNLNPLQTIALALRTGTTHIKVYPNIHLYVSSNASFHASKSLSLGCRWSHLRYLPGKFKLDKNARLIVDGDMAIHAGCHISASKRTILRPGKEYINNNCTIDCFNSISIGNNVAISKGATIRDSDNHFINNQAEISAPIVIDDHVWIGINATILKGVHVGCGAVIAAQQALS